MNNNALFNSDPLYREIIVGRILDRHPRHTGTSNLRPGLLLQTLGNHWMSSEPVASNCMGMSLPHFTGTTAKATVGTY